MCPHLPKCGCMLISFATCWGPFWAAAVLVETGWFFNVKNADNVVLSLCLKGWPVISVNIFYSCVGLVCSSCFFVLQLLYTLSEVLFGQWWKAPLTYLAKMGPSRPITVTLWNRQANCHTCVRARCENTVGWASNDVQIIFSILATFPTRSTGPVASTLATAFHVFRTANNADFHSRLIYRLYSWSIN